MEPRRAGPWSWLAVLLAAGLLTSEGFALTPVLSARRLGAGCVAPARSGPRGEPTAHVWLGSQRRRAPTKTHFSAPVDDGGPGDGGSAAVVGDGDYSQPTLDVGEELSDSFLRYAMSIIMGRALPDVRDGLKPVHRRILFAMSELNLKPNGGYRKCARVVGEVLGKFHPHGDNAVYDALVRMAQDFVMSAPLVAGHGNFGSQDNDPPAAMRYTECKLAALASDALLADLDANTVDFVPNFDGNEQEPVVLPARIPMLLLNGATGIAVGMATNIPPHNLVELVDGLTALIDDPDLSDEALQRLVPGPDFPTGGTIMGSEGIHALYTTGHGSVKMRAKTSFELIERKKGQKRDAIVVTELPYLCNKAALLEKIAGLVNEKKLAGISDLRDETDRTGVRVVIELKRDAVPAVVLNNLFQKTGLQTSFSGNFLALSNGGTSPKRFTLRQALREFLDFRFGVVRRRAEHRLSLAVQRDHIVMGLLQALDHIDDIIATIRKEPDRAAAKAVLATSMDFSEAQADAVLGLQLGRLTSLDKSKLDEEHKSLANDIGELNALMADDGAVLSLIKAEMREIADEHGVPRRTLIDREDEGDLNDLDLIKNDRSVVVVTRAGYIKRMPLDDEFSTVQGRGTRGKAGAKMSDKEDSVAHFFTSNDHDTILFFTAEGKAHALGTYKVPMGGRNAKGVPLPSVLPISADEEVASAFSVADFDKADTFLVMVTRRGWIKKTPVKAFEKTSARGLFGITVEEGDQVRWVRLCDSSDSVILGTSRGYAAHFRTDADSLRPTQRTSRGVKAMKLRDDDEIVDMDVLQHSNGRTSGRPRDSLLIMTTGGYGKRTPVSDFAVRGRGGLGIIATKFKKKGPQNDSLACLRAISEDDDIMLSTSAGVIVRQRAAAIPLQSRTATGVLVQKLDSGSLITDVAILGDSNGSGTDGAS